MKKLISIFLFSVFILLPSSVSAVVPALGWWLGSISFHAAVLALNWQPQTASPPIGTAFVSGLMNGAPLVVHLNNVEPLKTPAGWTAATGQPVTQTGTTYAANQPIPPVSAALFTDSLSKCDGCPFANSADLPNGIFAYMTRVNPLYTWRVQLQPNGLSYYSSYLNGTVWVNYNNHVITRVCSSGTVLQPDGVSCSPVKPADGTAEYYVDSTGAVVRDSKDGDPAPSIVSNTASGFKVTNPDGSFTNVEILGVANGIVQNAKITETAPDATGVSHVTNVYSVGQCYDTTPSHLCVTSTSEQIVNGTVSSITTDVSAGVDGVTPVTTVTNQGYASAPPGSGSGSSDVVTAVNDLNAPLTMIANQLNGTAPAYGPGLKVDAAGSGLATEGTLQGLLNAVTGGITDILGIDDTALGVKNLDVASITPVLVGDSGSCPAPHAMSLGGQTYYKSFTVECNYANGIRPILLAFAWLMAAGILIGGFKNP